MSRALRIALERSFSRLLLWFVLGSVWGAVRLPADENEDLERLLTRLGLASLQTLHLEQVIDEMSPGEPRRRMAERLADLYAGQLVENSEDKPAYDAVLQRIQRLVERIPEAKTASLEVMLLQADYLRAENLISKWTADRGATAARKEAAEILAKVAPQLDARQEQLRGTVDRLLAQLDETRDTDEQAAKNRELSRVEAVAGRASFFAAWSNYYWGLASEPTSPGHTGFAKARGIFRRILGIEGTYDEVQADALGLESIWRARTLIGLGMAEASGGNSAASKACFDLLERGAAPHEILEMAAYWRLQALLNANLFAEALDLAQRYVGALSGAASQGRVTFMVTLVRAGFAGGIPDPMRAQQLGKLGITGLIKLRQLGALRQLLDRYQIPLEGQAGFYVLWFTGQQQLEKAQASRRDEDYTRAAEALSAALAAPDARSDLGAAAQCRYQLAWCQYQLSQFADAARNYEEARDALKPTDRKTAGDAAWMAFACYQSLAKTQRQYVGRAVQVLSGLKRDFPNHEHAQRADYYIGKLQQAELPPDEMVRRLAAVKPDSPDYLTSRFEICELLYDQWQASAAEAKPAWGRKVMAAADDFLQAARSDRDTERKLRVSLRAADVALNGEPTDETAAARHLEAASSWVERASSLVAAEFHYRSLQLATRRRDDEARRRNAEWIVNNAAGSPFEVPALVIVAKLLDQHLTDDKASAGALREGFDVYRRLAARYGESPEDLRSKQNAQIAALRLADFAERLGEFETAERILSNLLAAFPADPAYLRRAGLVGWRLRKYAAALEHWRTLVAGLPKESEPWFEAKYYQLACLAQVDPPRAREAMQQFELLFPQLGSPSWRGRFAELQQRLGKSSG